MKSKLESIAYRGVLAIALRMIDRHSLLLIEYL